MLIVDRLTKCFGTTTAVKDVSFSVADGEIFGLLGQNGAGKTTTLRTLATMLQPTGGNATIQGYSLLDNAADIRGITGLLFGGDTGLYDRLTARENIAYFAALNGMGEQNARIEELAEMLNFTEFLDKWTGKLSKGTRQKVAFARAIVHDPSVMLFDEPTTGLDVTARKNVEDFITEMRKRGKTIILSDHNLTLVEKLCDHVAILHKGVLLDVDTIEKLPKKHNCATLEDVFFSLAGEKNV